ncbi:MAG: hypothetical protein H7258_13445 [Ferruginibacter sp.]|nr:hypothetical protein [Ferruginibacter sp.]
MKHLKFLFFIFFLISATKVNAQKILPGITVKNFGGKIIVSWQNAFTQNVTNILIQRSYDSLKNYTTIGTVLNPQSRENGYSDLNPPYTKMYYRVSVSFEGGDYIISHPERPLKDISASNSIDNSNNTRITDPDTRYPWLANPSADSIVLIAPSRKENEITYPSERIFTGRDNNIVIHLKDAASKKYIAKFFDDKDSLLFELTKLNDEYLIIERVNFGHPGWFHFEIYEAGNLIEKNKFQIMKGSGKLN